MKGKAGIILVNYKSYAERFLSECRDSLREQSYANLNVYIVDNAGTEETRQYLTSAYPEAEVIRRRDGNYAAANNAGIKKAREDGCVYFVIANMDTYFAPTWLEELIKKVDSEKNIGIAQSRILLYPRNKEEQERPLINSLGNIINYLGFGFTNGYGEPDDQVNDDIEINGYASGCSLVFKKEVIEDIGDYDEDYWMYHDDMEMGWRTRLAGWRIVLASGSICYHKYSFKRSVRMLYYMERNRYLVAFHYYRLPTLLLLTPAFLTMEAGMIIYSIPGGWLGTKIKADIYFLDLRNWVKIFKKRREIVELRRIKEVDVISSFSGRVLFQEIDNPVLKYIANPIFDFYWAGVKKILRR